MSSVKWSLLNLHVWSSVLDVYWSTFAIPFVIFPYMAGNGIGVLSMLGLNTGYQVYFSVMIVSVLVATMVRVYENRWFLLSRNRKLWRRIRGYACILNYIISAMFFIPFLFFVPDQMKAVPVVLEKTPCYHLYTQTIPLYVFTLNPIPVLATVALFSVLQISLMSLFVCLTVRVLSIQARRNTTSQYTVTLHRKFLYALMAQTGLPVILVFCPLLSLFYLVPMGYHNQMITNFIFISVSLHGFFSTVLLLLVHQPYRLATLRILKCGFNFYTFYKIFENEKFRDIFNSFLMLPSTSATQFTIYLWTLLYIKFGNTMANMVLLIVHSILKPQYQKSSLTTKYAMEEITKTSKFTMTITFTHLLFFGIYTACSLFVRVLGQQFFGSFINFYVARGINCAVPTYNLVIVIVGFISLYHLNRKRNQAVTTNVQMMSIGNEGAKNYDEAITNKWATVVSGKV
ncbi:hypothetical protein GCK72_020756 [Caenorhabditis remanei]|uniref:Uncharacterized protein n=1 Tax=Caenorhabditis remanei TaxID=31234 RepID=A0A6A5GHQ4_CAERE|nr:hypothetical protein GCK72_020756 [Caenorhabditis remanei]KAF1754196.1 hypothetical protein GCK72_020756 [Caenorhabditis remanei]